MIIRAEEDNLQKQFFERENYKKAVQNIFSETLSIIFSVSLMIHFITSDLFIF